MTYNTTTPTTTTPAHPAYRTSTSHDANRHDEPTTLGSSVNAVRDRATSGGSATPQSANAPSFIAYTVRDVEGRESGIWTRVGAAWTNRAGRGLNLVLDLVPLNGRLILLPAAEQPDYAE